MSILERHQAVRRTAGPAVGRLTGINHLQLVVRDMEETVVFYRDILGLELVKTLGKEELDAVNLTPVTKNYFFRLGNGDMLSLIECKAAPPPQRSIWDIWPADLADSVKIQKMDHLALNVETLEDLRWFVLHLRAHGIRVTDVKDVRKNASGPRAVFVHSIYLSDPSGIPLEIATFDWQDPTWSEHQDSSWYTDKNPVDSAIAE